MVVHYKYVILIVPIFAIYLHVFDFYLIDYCNIFQASVLRAWNGKKENVEAGQQELLKRAKVRYLHR